MNPFLNTIICLLFTAIITQAESIANLRKSIIFPTVEMENCQLVEAIDFLRLRTRELGPHGTNINMVILANSKQVSKIRIKKLSLKNAPLETVLTKICEATNFRYIIDKNALVFLPKETKRSSPLKKDDKGNGSKKLDNFVIPFCSFSNTTIEEATDYLSLRTKGTTPPLNLKFILKLSKNKKPPRISELALRNATLRETITYICELTGCTYSIKNNTITIEN